MKPIKEIAEEIANDAYKVNSNKSTIARAVEQALRDGREQCAKAICLFCADPERYGPPKEMEGSKRLWHADLRNDCNGVVQCQAAAIHKGD